MRRTRHIIAIVSLMASALMAETVYVSATGKTFHKATTCMALSQSKHVLQAQRADAEAHGLKPCGICYRVRKASKKANNSAWAK